MSMLTRTGTLVRKKRGSHGTLAHRLSRRPRRLSTSFITPKAQNDTPDRANLDVPHDPKLAESSVVSHLT